MALIRDPAFWRRFSVAVHLDEEAGTHPTMASPSSSHELKHADSWLARQRRKKHRRTCICWAFWIIFPLTIAAVVIVIWLLCTHKIGWHKDDSDNS